MQNLLKNKLLIIAIFFIVAIFAVTTNCFASFNFSHNEINYILPDLPDNVVNHDYVVFFSEQENKYKIFANINDDWELSQDGVYTYVKGYFAIYSYSIGNEESWVVSNNYNGSKLQNTYIFTDPYQVGTDNLSGNGGFVIYSTFDIIINDNLVFQVAPQATNLVQIVEQVETEKTMSEIVGILPIVIVVIVSLLGLRKALSFCLSLVKKA